MMKTAGIAFLLFAWGCELNDCGDLKATYINITGVEGKNMLLDGNSYYNAKLMEEKSEVSYEHYGLRITPMVEYYSRQQKKKAHFQWFPAAYACSPAVQPSEEIANIAVFSDADYVQSSSSKILAARDTLNHIFKIYDYFSGRIVGLSDFLIDEGLKASDEGFFLQPTAKPTAPQTHQFTVHYRLTNGEVYIFTADPIVLTP